MVRIIGIKDYTIPFFGNKRILPYGKLIVDGIIGEKLCPIKDDGARQYITYNRQRYYVWNAGELYYPKYEVIPSYNV